MKSKSHNDDLSRRLKCSARTLGDTVCDVHMSVNAARTSASATLNSTQIANQQGDRNDCS